MDYNGLERLKNGLNLELTILRREGPHINVPSIINLVEFEVNRLDDILLGFGVNDLQTDDIDEVMMVDSLVEAFGLVTTSSMEQYRNHLMQEYVVIQHSPQIPRTVYLVRIVGDRLERRIALATDESSGDSMSLDGSEPSESSSSSDQS